MIQYLRLCLVSGALFLSSLAVAQELPRVSEVDAPAVAAHVQRAKEIAGPEFDFLAESFLCRPAVNAIPDAIRDIPGFLDPNAPGVEPFAAFDNLYYVGQYAIGTWILDTGEGLIVFDALNSERDAKNILLPGMRELGLSAADMKRVVITHAHFDHYGGADFLRREFGIRIGMSGPDWDYLPREIARPYAVRAGYPDVVQPKRDLVIADGDTLAMGNATVTFVVTPGHTPGTLSSIITVRDKGEERTIGMWGGQALPRSPRELSQMHNSLHKFWKIGRERGVEGLISTHAWVVGNFELRARGRGVGENPQLIGREGFEQVMGIYDQCIHAQFARNMARQTGGRYGD